MSIPRLRMFAGPNGSGKSTLNNIVAKELLGVYINADEIEKEIKKLDFLDLSSYGITSDEATVLSFFEHHPLLIKADFDDNDQLKFTDNKIDFFAVLVNSYYASVCADFIRHELLKAKVSFTFETVMSSRDKVVF